MECRERNLFLDNLGFIAFTVGSIALSVYGLLYLGGIV